MSKGWVFLALICLLIAVILIAIGCVFPQLPSFPQNLVAEGIGLGLGFGIAILLIDRESLRRENRQRKILVRTARSITQQAAEIGQMLNWEIATWLASVLDTDVDFYAEDIGNDWDVDVKPLLRQIFNEAEAVGEKDVIYSDTIPTEDYRSRVLGIRDYSQRIRARFEANLEIHETLLELSEAFDSLDIVLTKCMWPSSMRTEVERYRFTGCIGNALVRLVETIGDIHFRYYKQNR